MFLMNGPEEVPVGRLSQVNRAWDYEGGWARVPIKEIAFNNRLTLQARNLWIWLSAVHPQARNISWADCERIMNCSTNSRRRCLGQLVDEGLVSVDDDGVVTMHNPYQAFKTSENEYISSVNFEWEYKSENEVVVVPATPKPEPEKVSKEEKNAKKAAKKSENTKKVIESWNNNKPESYSTLRNISDKQLLAVTSHMKNLNIKPDNVSTFIESICRGLHKSKFWSQQIDVHGRNFSAVFGYGIPQDKKLKNIETLFEEGQDESKPRVAPSVEYNLDQQELIESYNYIKFELQKARNRNNQPEITKWEAHFEEVVERLEAAGVDSEAI
jgi:hypothetical protein